MDYVTIGSGPSVRYGVMEHAGSLESTQEALELHEAIGDNIVGGIVHQIRCEKRTTISEVIVRGKRNIKQNRNWFHFKFSVESSSFILLQSKYKILYNLYSLY